MDFILWFLISMKALTEENKLSSDLILRDAMHPLKSRHQQASPDIFVYPPTKPLLNALEGQSHPKSRMNQIRFCF